MQEMMLLNAVGLYIFLQTVTYVAALPTCPPDSAVSPCLCHDNDVNLEEGDIALYCSSPSTTLGQIKNALTALKGRGSITVELDNLELGTLPSDFFEGLRVRRLDIYQCRLDSLSGGGGLPLAGLESTLEELLISSTVSEENELAKFSITHLSTLRELDISHNIITELGDEWFRSAPKSLRHILISNNGIERIGTKAFNDVINVEFLSLDGNRFGPLSRSMFPSPARELDALELDNNALTSLPDDIFTEMPYLRVVSLANNGIEFLPEKIWKDVWNSLDSVDLRGNPLRCDSHMDWMSQVPTCANIFASCTSPREKFGQDIPILRHKNCVNMHENGIQK